MTTQFKKRLLKLTALSIVILAVLLMTACDNRSTVYIEDNDPPPVPTGLTSITGDGVIWLEWNPIIGVDDLEGYNMYRSIDNHVFYPIATIFRGGNEYTDDDVINGETYYYGISSFDFDGNESNVSFDYDFVFDTPRPEGSSILYDFHDLNNAWRSGFDFSSEERVYFDDSRADIFFEYDSDPGVQNFYLWLGANGAQIQDMGYTDTFDDITYAPEDGWSQNPYIEAILGHTYVIRTATNYYAKVRIVGLLDAPYSMDFDWGYQIDRGNRELKIAPPDDKRERIIVRERNL